MRQREYDKHYLLIMGEYDQAAQAAINARDAKLSILDQIRNGSKRKDITKKVRGKAAKPVAPPEPPSEAAPILPLEGEK